jgi:hypothetical protein
MTFELDVVIDTDPANAPFGKAIGLPRQRVEVGPVELFEQRPAGDAEPPDQAFVVELPQQLTFIFNMLNGDALDTPALVMAH